MDIRRFRIDSNRVLPAHTAVCLWPLRAVHGPISQCFPKWRSLSSHCLPPFPNEHIFCVDNSVFLDSCVSWSWPDMFCWGSQDCRRRWSPASTVAMLICGRIFIRQSSSPGGRDKDGWRTIRKCSAVGRSRVCSYVYWCSLCSSFLGRFWAQHGASCLDESCVTAGRLVCRPAYVISVVQPVQLQWFSIQSPFSTVSNSIRTSYISVGFLGHLWALRFRFW